jgi:hypothetical protein
VVQARWHHLATHGHLPRLLWQPLPLLQQQARSTVVALRSVCTCFVLVSSSTVSSTIAVVPCVFLSHQFASTKQACSTSCHQELDQQHLPLLCTNTHLQGGMPAHPLSPKPPTPPHQQAMGPKPMAASPQSSHLLVAEYPPTPYLPSCCPRTPSSLR